MHTQQTRTELWQRIQSLMIQHWGIESQNRLAREAGVGVATVARLKSADSSVGLDVLEKVADALGVQAWQLICPASVYDIGPSAGFSPMARDLASSLDRIGDPHRQRKAYAIASQVLALGTSAEPERAAGMLDQQPTPSPAQHQ